MNSIERIIYYNSGEPIRSLLASIRGYSLKKWRYDKDTEKTIDIFTEREFWSEEKWNSWQEERLAFILDRAVKKIPYYRKYWNDRRKKGDKASYELLFNWPVLKKEMIRNSSMAFVAEDCNLRKMFKDYTSGTSGTPLVIYESKETVKNWYALYEARIRRWHGVSINQKWGILGGQLVIPYRINKPPFWVHNFSLNQLYLSTHHLSPANAMYYVEKLNKFKPTHLVVYPSSAAILAKAAIEQSLKLPEMKVIFSNAEYLSENYKQIIEKAFNCKIINTYGMCEIVTSASECCSGIMHIWPEVGKVEVLDDNNESLLNNDKIGRLVSTGLFNPDMILIRYETGDRINYSNKVIQCKCGRFLPKINKIEGRINDLILTPDGRKIFWLNPIFYDLPIIEAQIIQENINYLKIMYVPDRDFTETHANLLIDRLNSRVGEMDIYLENVDIIPRSKNGKFKAIINKII